MIKVEKSATIPESLLTTQAYEFVNVRLKQIITLSI